MSATFEFSGSMENVHIEGNVVLEASWSYNLLMRSGVQYDLRIKLPPTWEAMRMSQIERNICFLSSAI